MQVLFLGWDLQVLFLGLDLQVLFFGGGLQVFVGDGFIRPEATSLCVNGRYPPRIDERAYLGTDKSVPYR
ncbi:MAG: hypothetical protein FWG87_06795, partial [Defluviitaleaceae bacterium]|nr:hypothetical protein [Defluviitaleaceae bacterium]